MLLVVSDGIKSPQFTDHFSGPDSAINLLSAVCVPKARYALPVFTVRAHGP